MHSQDTTAAYDRFTKLQDDERERNSKLQEDERKRIAKLQEDERERSAKQQEDERGRNDSQSYTLMNSNAPQIAKLHMTMKRLKSSNF